jgi:two-component system, NarL family, response regulator NreC
MFEFNDAIRVVLADDHAVVRAGLKAVLSSARDIEVVGEAENGVQAVALAEKLHPDVVVMDLTMPTMDGTTATREITAKVPGTRVLVLTMHTESEYVIPAMEAGALGYLPKTDADRDLPTAIRAVAHGDQFAGTRPSRWKREIAEPSAPGGSDRERFEHLTCRERDVLRLISRGYSAPEVGQRLSISPKTVDTYKQRIQVKLSLSHRSEYVQFALRLGLLAAD